MPVLLLALPKHGGVLVVGRLGVAEVGAQHVRAEAQLAQLRLVEHVVLFHILGVHGRAGRHQLIQRLLVEGGLAVVAAVWVMTQVVVVDCGRLLLRVAAERRVVWRSLLQGTCVLVVLDVFDLTGRHLLARVLVGLLRGVERGHHLLLLVAILWPE